MVTIKEIAQMCGVSSSTVSNILNGRPKVSEVTKQRVLDAVRETGYQPNFFAQGMRKINSRIIGIITEDLAEFSTLPIVEAVMAHCEEHNYRTILVNMRLYDRWQDTWYNDETKYQSMLQPALHELLSIKVNGIIYIAGHCRIINCFPDDFPIPAITTYGISKSKRFTSLVLDDEQGGYDMMKYLISMGHKKIGILSGASDNIHAQKRMLGCQRALYESQIPFNPSLVRYGDWQRGSGYTETAELMKSDITGIFCMNDVMAAGAYDYFYEKGMRIGEDFSLVGYDNHMISEYLRPKLTTCNIPLKEIAMKSARIMLDMLDEEKTQVAYPDLIATESHIIVRDSVKKILYSE